LKAFSKPMLLFNSSLLLLLTAVLIRKIDDYDIWYHISLGREVLGQMRLPGGEFYIYTLLGEKAVFPEWGFGTIFYAAYEFLGYAGMGLLNAAIGALSIFIFHRAASEEGRFDLTGLLPLAALVWSVKYRLVYRPETMLFLALAFTFYFLEKFRKTGDPGRAYPIPLIPFLLGMFHPSALFVLAVFGFYLVDFLWSARGKEDFKPRARKLVLIFLLSVLASGLNPYGFGQLILPVKFLQQSEILGIIHEFMPVLKTGYKVHFLVISAVALVSLLLPTGRKIVYWLLFLSFGYLAFKHVRNLALFAFVMYIPVKKGFDFILPHSRKPVMLGLKALGVAALIFVTFSLFGSPSWGTGPAKNMFPEKSAEFILNERPPCRIFNFYNMGGYLAWRLYPDYMVSIDGRRYEMDRSMQLFDQVFWGSPGWEETLSRYNAGILVTPALTGGGELLPIISLLDRSEEWLLALTEPSGLLFIRRDIAAGLTGFSPMPKNLIWAHVINEASGVIAGYPNARDAYRAMGVSYFNLRDFGMSREYFRIYLALNPGDREAGRIINLITGAEMGDIEARRELENLYRESRNLR